LDREKANKSSFYNPTNKKPPSANSPYSTQVPTIIKRQPTTLRSIRPSEENIYSLNNHRFFTPKEIKVVPSRATDV
jgi:hypothetical protein